VRKETPLQAELAWLASQLSLHVISQQEHDEKAAAARVRLGGAS
jgi:hypothetical protein